MSTITLRKLLGGWVRVRYYQDNSVFSSDYNSAKVNENKGARIGSKVNYLNHDGSNAKDAIEKLTGTTLKVYRFLYRKGRPMGVHEVQKGLRLSSPSVSSYHLKKLLQAGLVRESSYGYFVDKVVFENTIRLGKARIPFKSSIAIFFGVTLGILLTVLRPSEITSAYLFAIGVNASAFVYSLYETVKVLRRIY